MNKLKELWSYAVFRWCVYQTPLLVFGLLLMAGQLDVKGAHDSYEIQIGKTAAQDLDLESLAIPIWFLIFAPPAVWVWRKPIWKAIGFLNKKAEEG